MPIPRIRPIESSHIGELIRIADETSLNHWSAESYLAELKNPHSIAHRLESDDNHTIGFVVGRIVPAADSADHLDAEIYNIGVIHSEQGQGNGHLLIDEFSRECRAKYVRSIWLEVRESNLQAISFYLRNDFLSVNLRRDFYSDPRENAIVMRRMLDQDRISIPRSE
jgi:ribosomal-protein-alanine N-acetyltransferase